MSLDLIQYPSSEITDPMRDDRCCPSPLQLTDAPPPELFDQECDNDEEVREFNCSPEQMGTFFPSSRDTNPAIYTKISTPMQALISSTELTDPLPYIPPLNPAEAHGTMDLDTNFLAGDYSTARQQLESVAGVDPAALPVHVISDSEAQMAPVKKPFKCPHCSFSSEHKHNLKTHFGTHNEEVSKRFGCSTCGRPFSREHDLHRHHQAIHGNRTLSSSSSSLCVSSLRPNLPQYRTTTVSGGERLTSSLHPGSFSDTGLEESNLMARWENATWLQGA